jgi:hypothetical protein
MMSYLSNEFNILADLMENSLNEIDDENVDDRKESLKKMVEYHQALLG